MRHFSLRRVKTLFLTLFSFGFCFVLLLNLMIHQLNTDRDLELVKDVHDPEHTMKLRQLSQQEDSNYIHAAGIQWVDRKPKAANVKNMGEGDYGKSKIGVRSDMLKLKSGESKYKHNEIPIEKVKGKDKSVLLKKDDKFLFPNRRKNDEDDYSYEEDIEKVVIQDEDEDDDDKNEYYNDDIDPDEDYDEDAAQGNAPNVFDNLQKKNRSKEVFTKPPLQFQAAPPVALPRGHKVKNMINSTENRIFKHELVVNGIFWSKQVENIIPKGFSHRGMLQWLPTIRAEHVRSLQPPSWDKCGQPKNGFVVMNDGTALCARYRHPHNKFVLGEVLSFYLSLLLGMDNVPGVLLSRINRTSSQWYGKDTETLGWTDNQFVALIQWIDDMTSHKAHVKMPAVILDAYKTGYIVNSDTIKERELGASQVSEIVQWGTMVIFDFLTGNYDRVASMQDAAEKEKSPKIIQDNIRNLRKSTSTQKMWLIDNESGLLDAYDLLYRSGANGDRFLHYHKEMLKTMCIFQRPLVDALKTLSGSINPHDVLVHFAKKHEPLLDEVPKDATFSLFQSMFSKRLGEVTEWVRFCQESHSR